MVIDKGQRWHIIGHKNKLPKLQVTPPFGAYEWDSVTIELLKFGESVFFSSKAHFFPLKRLRTSMLSVIGYRLYPIKMKQYQPRLIIHAPRLMSRIRQPGAKWVRYYIIWMAEDTKYVQTAYSQDLYKSCFKSNYNSKYYYNLAEAYHLWT